MEYIEAKQIVLDSIRKVIPQEVEIPENENLLVHISSLRFPFPKYPTNT